MQKKNLKKSFQKHQIGVFNHTNYFPLYGMIYRAADVILWPQFNFLLRVCSMATKTNHPDFGGRTSPSDEEVYKKVKEQMWILLIALTHSIPVRGSAWRRKQNAVSQRDEELARTAGFDAPHPPCFIAASFFWIKEHIRFHASLRNIDCHSWGLQPRQKPLENINTTEAAQRRRKEKKRTAAFTEEELLTTNVFLRKCS